ncbi:5'-deoxynucleotidase [Paenibacillus chartarius]|uniref:5'-deoxynucleotidase n=1 Tax=Paenibacillus chartarius TaxID=747481 RepID=A0ABV6DNB7_9BACL
MDSPFSAYLYRLRYIDRWSLMWNTRKESVAEHSFFVAALAHQLCTIANEVFGRSVPTERVVSLALFHDVSEVFVGDIPQPVKHNNEKLRSQFHLMEREASERLVQAAPQPLRAVYRQLLVEPDPELYRWVKAADLLDAYLKCVTELAAGNREFTVARQQVQASLDKLGMPEIGYFLEHLGPSFEKTLDEMSLLTGEDE